MRRGLITLGILVFLIVCAAATLAFIIATDPFDDNGGGAGGRARLDLSFKPFELDDLLHHRTEVDLKTSGKRITSPEFNRIKERTSRLRELPLKKEIPLVEASRGVVLVELVTTFETDTPDEEIEADEKLLVALGLLKPGQDLESIMIEVLTEQIAGSYDTETEEITIVAGEELGSAGNEITMSHEVCHGLQDQNFDLDNPTLNNDSYNGDEDTAILSLIEGDATNTMYEYARTYISVPDLVKMQREASGSQSEKFDAAPLYIRRSLLFPYESGYEFVQALVEKGGEDSVDRAFASPPLSTEQILHPEKYIEGSDPPREVPLPDLTAPLGPGWKKINDDCMGEFDIQVWFEQYTTRAETRKATEGWGGNTIQYYQGPGRNYVMPIMTVWDSETDAREFFEGYRELLKGRFRNTLREAGSTPTSYTYRAGNAYYYCGIDGDATLALQSPDRETLDAALAAWPQMTPVP